VKGQVLTLHRIVNSEVFEMFSQKVGVPFQDDDDGLAKRNFALEQGEALFLGNISKRCLGYSHRERCRDLQHSFLDEHNV
jgi:hypothetical protein